MTSLRLHKKALHPSHPALLPNLLDDYDLPTAFAFWAMGKPDLPEYYEELRKDDECRSNACGYESDFQFYHLLHFCSTGLMKDYLSGCKNNYQLDETLYKLLMRANFPQEYATTASDFDYGECWVHTNNQMQELKAQFVARKSAKVAAKGGRP